MVSTLNCLVFEKPGFGLLWKPTIFSRFFLVSLASSTNSTCPDTFFVGKFWLIYGVNLWSIHKYYTLLSMIINLLVCYWFFLLNLLECLSSTDAILIFFAFRILILCMWIKYALFSPVNLRIAYLYWIFFIVFCVVPLCVIM